MIPPRSPATAHPPGVPFERRLFCNRTLNLRGIQAVGYDMDYTLVHYRVEEWEQRAYAHMKSHFAALGWPVGDLVFDPNQVVRGLIVDLELGNLVKANRFGFIKRASHGTRDLSFEAQRDAYSRTIIDLHDKRWVFLNTLFSLSEACFFAQLIDLMDDRRVPEVMSYAELYERVRKVIDTAHMEGKLKAEIVADPDRFVLRDAETALALLDQHRAGKKLLLITNSEWHYTVAMMSYAFDPFLPQGMSWRDLFQMVIVGARKPEFFTMRSPLFEIVSEDGLLRPAPLGLKPGVAYLGGSAREVERFLNLSGDEILYVGDHMFGDVKVTKNVLRWRTALILRELEEDIAAERAFLDQERQLEALMIEKEGLEARLSQIRLGLQRLKLDYGPRDGLSAEALQREYDSVRSQVVALDQRITPLARASSELNNSHWGLLMRTGSDKSHLAFQVERYADVYTSRVSNFLYSTPFAYLRSARGSLPHDQGA